MVDGSGKGCSTRFLSAPSMRKVCDGEVEVKKRIVKIAVHYRRASHPPEQQPTGTSTAQANSRCKELNQPMLL